MCVATVIYIYIYNFFFLCPCLQKGSGNVAKVEVHEKGHYKRLREEAAGQVAPSGEGSAKRGRGGSSLGGRGGAGDIRGGGRGGGRGGASFRPSSSANGGRGRGEV